MSECLDSARYMLQKSKQDIASFIAEVRKMEAQRDTERAHQDEWLGHVRLAAQEGRDDLGNQAMMRVREHRIRERHLEALAADLRKEEKQFRQWLYAINDRLQSMKTLRATVVAKTRSSAVIRTVTSNETTAPSPPVEVARFLEYAADLFHPKGKLETEGFEPRESI